MPDVRPEILAPAGCLRRLQTAVRFGADAVYVGGQRFSLRKHADNLADHELAEGIAFAHAHGSRVYVTCNIHPLERDWPGLAAYVERLQRLGPDAVIVADPGVAAHIRRHTDLRIHVSTQASVTNSRTAALWRERGASRIVVARELSLAQTAAIKTTAGIEVETFVHGAQCASYSGKCVISNYTAGRDANRGGCVQTCRNTFTVHTDRRSDSPVQATASIMNARDQHALELIPRLVAAGIDACKIEGRMKSALYVACTVASYRRAVDGAADNPAAAVLDLLSNRGYGVGGLAGRPFVDSLNLDYTGYRGGLTSLGQVVESDPELGALLPLRAPLVVDEEIGWLRPDGAVGTGRVRELRDTAGRRQSRLGVNRAAWLRLDEWMPLASVAWLPRPGDHVRMQAGTGRALAS